MVIHMGVNLRKRVGLLQERIACPPTVITFILAVEKALAESSTEESYSSDSTGISSSLFVVLDLPGIECKIGTGELDYHP